MSFTAEINDSQQARQYLLETFSLSRFDKLTPMRLLATLQVALELASEGHAVSPLGFISDLLSSLGGAQYSASTAGNEAWSIAPPDASLLRRYEDYVLGKFAADMSLERASDEMQKYKDRDRDRALAYAVQQVQTRADLPCVLIGPAAIKALSSLSGPALQKLFYESLASGISPMALEHWDELIQAVRNSGELLGVEDIFELASGTALSKFGQRLALRQVMQASQHLSIGLPKQKPTGAKRHYAVATNILEEDLYPVGGFSSIANRGTMESLLRSELAYMEVDERPDLFDIKYARDELLYYSRDENQFFRRRVTVMFVLEPSLSAARVKDPGAAWQRIVLAMAVVVAMVRTLTDWLASDSLKFEVLFAADVNKGQLTDEWNVIEMLLHDEIQAGRLAMAQVDAQALRARCEENTRQSMCYCVRMHAQVEDVDVVRKVDSEVGRSVWQPLRSELSVAQPLPRVGYDDKQFEFTDANEPWREAVRTLLESVNT